MQLKQQHTEFIEIDGVLHSLTGLCLWIEVDEKRNVTAHVFGEGLVPLAVIVAPETQFLEAFRGWISHHRSG